jgi:hypothetical protein
MTTSEITEAYQVGAVKLETFVFRAGMPTWVTLLEVPEIVEALAETGDDAALASRALRASASSLPPPRKAPARGAAGAAEAGSHELPLSDAPADESDDALPFALESERGMREPEAGGSRSQTETDPLLAPLTAPEPAATAAPPADSEAAAVAAEGSPAGAEPADATLLTPPTDEATRENGVVNPSAAGAGAKSSSWIWLIILALLIGAALALLVHRFGPDLR